MPSQVQAGSDQKKEIKNQRMNPTLPLVSSCDSFCFYECHFPKVGHEYEPQLYFVFLYAKEKENSGCASIVLMEKASMSANVKKLMHYIKLQTSSLLLWKVAYCQCMEVKS